MVVLDSELSVVVPPGRADLFCNRPSAFYWLQTSQTVGGSGRSIPTHVFATIFGEWYRQYDNQPNIEFGHNPIRMTERGPTTIRGIVRAHFSGLEKAKAMLHEVELKDYQAIIDRNELFDQLEEFRRLDRYIRLQEIAHFQSIIIARTGAEEDLSAPISFESLLSNALPLDRNDFDGKPNVDVLRVTLPDAVRFVIDLERREDLTAFMERTVPPIERMLTEKCEEVFPEDGGLCDSPNTWADEHIKAAENHNYEYCQHTAQSIRRVQAQMNGEIYMLLSPMWFCPRWIDYEGELGEQL